jgi:integrase
MGVTVNEWKGAWWLFVHHKGQRWRKRVGTGPGSKKSAELAAIQLRARLAVGDLSVMKAEAPAVQAPTFASLAEEWLHKYPALHAIRDGTLANYRSFTENHLLPFFGHHRITDITPTMIEDFIEAKRAPGGSVRRVGKGLSDASLRTGLLSLRLILQRAVRIKCIPSNPMNDVDWRGLPRMENVDPFTVRELQAILAAANGMDGDFGVALRLWAQTGMRAGEVCGLQRRDLDLERGTATVQRTWSRQRLGPTKTGHVRSVVLEHPVAEDTSDWRPRGSVGPETVVAGLRRLTVQGLDEESFVFGRADRPLSSMELHRRWRRVLAKAGVRYRSPEQLRHTFASIMLSRNAPLLYVQQQGGWRSASVLLRTYARWMPQDVASPSATLAPPALGAATASAG